MVMNTHSQNQKGKCCKWCQISESTLVYLLDVDRRTYCTNENGHEWIEDIE